MNMGWTRQQHKQAAMVRTSHHVSLIHGLLLFFGLIANLVFTDIGVIFYVLMAWCLWCFDASMFHRMFRVSDQSEKGWCEQSAWLGMSVQSVRWSDCEILWWAWPFVVLQIHRDTVWLMGPSVQPILIDLVHLQSSLT